MLPRGMAGGNLIQKGNFFRWGGGGLLGGGGEVLRMEGGLGRGWEGGLPRLGGEAGSVLGGRLAGLRRWMEMESVFGPIWRRKDRGEQRRTRKGPE